MNFLEKLPKPFFVLAPMDDVTDTVFRQIVADCAKPDLFMTEFVNVDGLQSPGRPKLLHKLAFTAKEKPIIAQIWGKEPENFYKTVREMVDGSLIAEIEQLRVKNGNAVLGSQEERMSRRSATVNERLTPADTAMRPKDGGTTSLAGRQTKPILSFAGVDINMGCPVKAVVKNGCCIAMVNNRELAGEIISSVREAAGEHFPVSVKTRLGLNTVDLGWVEFLLSQTLNMLTIHGRTAKQLSKTPANWDIFDEIVKLRDQLSTSTLIVGNGDVANLAQAEELAGRYKLDGVMIGRGIFDDPFIFSNQSPWTGYTKMQKVALYKKHDELFAKTYKNRERNVKTLNKFCEVYINGFDGAKELRGQLMSANSADELLRLLD